MSLERGVAMVIRIFELVELLMNICVAMTAITLIRDRGLSVRYRIAWGLLFVLDAVVCGYVLAHIFEK